MNPVDGSREYEPLVELVRGDVREGVHDGSVVVTRPDGSVLHAVGEVTAPMYPRSTHKPAQAVAMLRSGFEPADDAELALAASSHNGEADHVHGVRRMLQRHGLTEDALQCPPDWPLHEQARDQQAAEGIGQQRITMNCSGKHTAMLATCLRKQWSTDNYLQPKHPLQIAIHETIAELTGEPIAANSTDGCGAPLLAVSLTGMAMAFSTMVTTASGPERAVVDAMRAHPWLVAGTGREDTLLMRAVPGLVSKAGAEGVLTFALPDGHAVAIKIADGARRALLPVAVGALRALGSSGHELDQLATHPLFGGGEPVGTVQLLGPLFG